MVLIQNYSWLINWGISSGFDDGDIVTVRVELIGEGTSTITWAINGEWQSADAGTPLFFNLPSTFAFAVSLFHSSDQVTLMEYSNSNGVVCPAGTTPIPFGNEFHGVDIRCQFRMWWKRIVLTWADAALWRTRATEGIMMPQLVTANLDVKLRIAASPSHLLPLMVMKITLASQCARSTLSSGPVTWIKIEHLHFESYSRGYLGRIVPHFNFVHKIA